jgi:hypothetical protein
MIPGTIQFRKHCENILPQRGGEPKAHYIARLARHFGFTTARMTVLYYDQRKDNARFTPDEYNTIFLRNSTGSAPIRTNHPHLNELKTKLEEQDKNISRLEKILEREITFKRKLGELLAQH